VHNQALKELEELESKREHLREKLRRLGDPLELTKKAVSAMREERQQLIDDLESERERHEQLEQERLKLQQDVQRLEDERGKGFWRRLSRTQ
jgi:chromosome segregation ATPase